MQNMKKTSKAVTSATTNTAQPESATLIGNSKKKSMQIVLKKTRTFGQGTIFATKSSIYCLPRKKKKYLAADKKKPLEKQSSTANESPMHTSRSAIGATQAQKPDPIGNATLASNSTDIEVNQAAANNLLMPQSTDAAIEMVRQQDMTPTSQSECGKKPAKDHEKLQNELEHLGAIRKAGLDPDLKIRHVCALVQESHASVYRKIKQREFPAPIKRGKGSFWPLSQIELYKSGEWAALSSLMPPAVSDTTPDTD